MKSKVMFNNYIIDHEIKQKDEMIESGQQYSNFRQKIGANPDLEKKIIKRRIGMEWSAVGRLHNVMKSNFPPSLKEKFIIFAFYQFLHDYLKPGGQHICSE